MTWGWWAGSQAAATPATTPRVRELDQSGWNAGYREGEMERQALELRLAERDIHTRALDLTIKRLKAEIARLTKETP